MKTSHLAGMTVLIALALVALGAEVSHASTNAIINGDFQTGALAPSTSTYAQSGDMGPAETWAITSSDTLNPAWTDFFDHTKGNADGRFMVVNGSSTGGGPAWSQQVPVLPHTVYVLSGWYASVNEASPAALEFRVHDSGGVVAAHAFQLSDTAAQWSPHCFAFSSGLATALTIQVWDTTDLFFGNDYAIDDLGMSALAELPQLAIHRSTPPQVELSWTTNSPDVGLETAFSLPASSWSDVTDPSVVADGQFNVTVSATNAQQYFRLECD